MTPIVIDRWSDGVDDYFIVEFGCMKCDVKVVKRPVADYVYVMDCENGKELYEDDPDVGIRNLEPHEYNDVVLAVRNIVDKERRN